MSFENENPVKNTNNDKQLYVKISWKVKCFYINFMEKPPKIKPIDLPKNNNEYYVSYLPEAYERYGINGPRPVIRQPIPKKEPQ